MPLRTTASIAVVNALLLLAACGSTGVTGAPPASDGTVSGTVVKGPVGGASVVAYAVTNGTMGAPVGGATTDATGQFTLSIGTYAGPLMIQASGGAYTDEATGRTMPMQPGDILACAIPSVAAGSTTTGIQVTPLTTMAHARAHHVTGGITTTSIAAANAAVGAYFSVPDILGTPPVDPMVAGSGAGASQAARNHGMAIAAMSQYALDVGMPYSSGMVTAMADDASDGVMDGEMAGTAIPMGGGMMGGTMMQATAGTSGLAASMATFLGSPMNRSGLTPADMQALMSQLSGSGGQTGAGGGTTMGMITGGATKGAVGGATVAAYAVSGGMMGAQLGTTTTDPSGAFRVPLGSYGGPVILQVSGGTYVDEATGTTMPLMTGDVMATCLAPVAVGSTTNGIQVTPLTTMAWSRAQAMLGGFTDANVGAANAAVGSYFSVSDIVHVPPMDPAVAGSGASATGDQRNYGMTIAAMSQYAHTVGMGTSSSGMVTAMMKDASDGRMDGTMGGSAISMAGMGGMMGGGMMASTAGTTGMATAMSTFAGSPMNRSGVTASDMQPLVNRLAGSSGVLQ
ncbi:MAG: hypothetical protein WB493_00730 [Anaeromyxobacteraceae bacterium]